MRINNKIIVFFVTAFEIYQEALEQLFPNLNKDCFITKPLTMIELIQRVTAGFESLR